VARLDERAHRAALDAAPIPTVILRDTRVVYANDAILEILRTTREAFLGRPYTDFVAPDELARVADRQARRLRGEHSPSVYTTTLLLGEERRSVQVHAAVTGGDIVVQFLDITGEEARRMRLSEVARLGALVQRELHEKDVHRAVLEALPRLELEGIVFRPDGDHLRIEAAQLEPGRAARFAVTIGRSWVGSRHPWIAALRQAWRDGAAFMDEWLGELRRLAPGPLPAVDAEDAARCSAAAVRVDVGGRPDAILVAIGRWLRAGDLPAFWLFGSQVSAALDAARSIQVLSRRNAELAALNRVAEAAGAAPDVQSFLAQASGEIVSALGCATVGFSLLDREKREWRLLHLHGGREEDRLRLARAPLEGTLFSEPEQEGAVQVRNADESPEPLRALLSGLGLSTVVSVPVRFQSTVIGAMSVGFREMREPSECRTELLQAMGAHFSGAVETHRLLADLRGRVAELTLLNDIAVATATLDPVLLLENALRRISATFGADAAAAFVVKGEELVQTASLGAPLGAPPQAAPLSAPPPAARLPVGVGPAGLAVAQRKAVHLPDLAAGGERAWVVDGGAVSTAVGVPLLVKGRALGAFTLGRRERAPFSDAELSLLSAIGVQLGVAVENARLFADTRRRISDLEAVNSLALSVFGATPGDTKSLLESACREMARVLSATSVVVLQLDASGTTLTGAAAWGTPLPPGELVIPLSRSTLARRALLTQAPAWGLHVFDAAVPGEAGPPPLSLLVVPLTSRRDTRGVVAIADAPQRRFSDAEIALAQALASEAAMGLENAVLYAEERRRVEELSLLNEVGRSVAGSLDLDRILGEGARAARQLLSATHCHVLLVDALRRELRYGASTAGEVPGLLEGAASLDAPLLAAATVRERRPFALHELASSAFRDVAEEAARGARAILAAPVLFRDQPMGVLVVSDHGEPRRFTATEIERAMGVANQLAVAIDNARLFDETRRRAEELGLLLEVGRSLVATLELEQVLEAGVRNLARIVDAPGAYLLLPDASGARLVIRAASGGPPGMVGRSVPLEPGDSVASWVFLRRTPLVIEDGLADPRVHGELQAATGGRAYLGVPLVVRDRAVGVSIVVDTRGPRLFTPAQVDRAATMATQLAVALENARLYEDLRRSYAELARAQDQLVRQERLAALGELAAVVAHEVRNPLGAIFNSLGRLRRLVRPAGDAKMLFDIVGEEADRLNRIVGELLDFAKPSPLTVRAEPLERVLDEAVSAALEQTGGRIALARDVPDGLPLIPMDARLMRQALLNVALNAVQAMPERGTLSVNARVVGDAAVVELGDTGPGIPHEIRHRIFEPFFTTKATGTGLGLAVVKRIIDDHRGRVEVRGPASGGTVFAIHLPLTSAAGVQRRRPA